MYLPLRSIAASLAIALLLGGPPARPVLAQDDHAHDPPAPSTVPLTPAPSEFRAFPLAPNLTSITPKVVATRLAAVEPFVVQVSAHATRATFSDGGAAFRTLVGRDFDPYSDLEFSWDFGDPDDRETIAHPVTGTALDASAAQTGGHAAYAYREPGAYTITLTARAWTGAGYVTASTTALATEEFQQLSLRNAPSGGTYTVSFAGATTAPVAWNARCDELDAALEALPTIGPGNVEVYGGVQPAHSRPFHIYFTGDFAGVDHPLLEADASGLLPSATAGLALPAIKIKEEVAGATATHATCTAFAGETRYFDGTYVDSPPDGIQGTISRPYTTFAELRAWLAPTTTPATVRAPMRRAFLKRGSSLSGTSPIALEGAWSGGRIAAYGDGPRPRLTRPSGPVLLWQNSYETSPGRANLDWAVDGIEFEGDSDTTVQGVYTTTGTSANFFGLPRHFVFLDCRVLGGFSFAVGATDVALWRCEFAKSATSAYVPGMPCATGDVRWKAIVGCSFSGGGKRLLNGVPQLDHFIYSSQASLALYRWLDFGLSDAANYCLNGNLPGLKAGSPKLAPYHLVDGCDVTGTQNGLDFSSTDNDPKNAYLDKVVVQDCDFHVGQVGNQGFGILANNPALITIRGNRFWSNKQQDVVLAGLLRFPTIYRNKSWRERGAFFRAGAGLGGWVAYNEIQNSLLPSPATHVNGLMTAYPAESMRKGWTVDGNKYHAPVPAFWDATNGRTMPVETWKGMGFDGASEFSPVAFGWRDPSAGDFSVPVPVPPVDPDPDVPPVKPKKYEIVYMGNGIVVLKEVPDE